MTQAVLWLLLRQQACLHKQPLYPQHRVIGRSWMKSSSSLSGAWQQQLLWTALATANRANGSLKEPAINHYVHPFSRSVIFYLHTLFAQAFSLFDGNIFRDKKYNTTGSEWKQHTGLKTGGQTLIVQISCFFVGCCWSQCLYANNFHGVTHCTWSTPNSGCTHHDFRERACCQSR